MTVRIAVINRNNAGVPNADAVKSYLYSNYEVLAETRTQVFIQGTDSAGFTLDAILDRLASGLIWGKELKPVN